METLLRRQRAQVKKLEVTAASIAALTDSTFNVPYCESLLEEMVTLEEKLDDIHNDISEECDNAAYKVVETELKAPYITLGQARKKLLTLKSKAAAASGSSVPVSAPKSEFRLPTLDIPSFSGDPMAWLSFKGLYEASIHNNPNLGGSQKLQYLMTKLEGEALGMVKSYSINDSNYDEAWKSLKERYESTREIVSFILRKLTNQPQVKEEDAGKLRTLIDTTLECLRSLKVLKQPVDKWDAILVHLLFEKLDNETRKQWELSLNSNDVPTFAEFQKFLEVRSRSLAVMSGPRSVARTSAPQKNASSTSQSRSSHHSSVENCLACDKTHPLYTCPAFQKMTVKERMDGLKNKDVCYNCFRKGHKSSDCSSDKKCKKCQKKHHTMLHYDSRPSAPSTGTSSSGTSYHGTSSTGTSYNGTSSSGTSYTGTSSTGTSSIQQSLHVCKDEKRSLLGTAIVYIVNCKGQLLPCRALVDGGSEPNLITEACVRRLGVSVRRTRDQLLGAGSVPISSVRGRAQLTLRTPTSPFQEDIEAFVLPEVTGQLPKRPFSTRNWLHLKNLDLADPKYNVPSSIDLILSVSVLATILKPGLRKGPPGTPIAQNTEYGWVISGGMNGSSHSFTVCHAQVNLDTQIERFWNIESVPTASPLTEEEQACESFYLKTTRRDPDGRYVVTLPFKVRNLLGSSLEMALRRFYSLERSLQRNKSMDKYREVIQEYITLGHMVPVPSEDMMKPASECYYMPHHAVYKESSSTTKLRVVFDASAKTTNGTSLNDIMMCGPKVNDDLIVILLRFRIHLIPLVSDAEKMYRMVRISPDQTDFQRILWRDNPQDEVKVYKMTVLTFGEKAAPWLATRTTHKLADDEEQNHPGTSHVVKRDLYVDDLLTGCSSQSEAIELRKEVQLLMQKGGFIMRKWLCPNSAVMASIPEDLRGNPGDLPIDIDASTKTLGIKWNTSADRFTFDVSTSITSGQVSKRFILSEISKLFDPLGWLSPVILRPKLLMQEIWKSNLTWDDPVPSSIQEQWRFLVADLPQLKKISIPRCISLPNPINYELHGFSDASEKAYGAVVYLKVKSDSATQVRLVVSKCRVAPLSPPLTVPRLELCGAVLLVNLLEMVKKSLPITTTVHGWTDSMVVLHWIKSPPTRWKTFVANRVGHIQETLPECIWNHVRTEDNPADLCSRGLPAEELKTSSLWWNGPSWLSTATTPSQPLIPENKEEARSHHVQIPERDDRQLQRASSFLSLIRTTARIMRLFSNKKLPKEEQVSGPLTMKELKKSEFWWIKEVQGQAFAEEIKILKSSKNLPFKSKILPLSPFLDSNQLLRVGGRLQHAQISFNKKFPILLPSKSRLVELIVQQEHFDLCHAGPQLMMSSLRQRFWILGARDLVRRFCGRCVVCAKVKGKTMMQFMGNLPAVRVTPTRPFTSTGVDFAGPFLLRSMKGRSQKQFKAYVCLFVCMSTKAIHLELVSDLSSDAFLASFRRFIARRGKPASMFSDCGTNFVGASKELRQVQEFLEQSQQQEILKTALSSEGIDWAFNPPAAPHFGGIWEAGVKSVKYHLRRIVGNNVLNFEEMMTCLTQIEACLNSRPLMPLSTDPNDLEALTPGHFLIGTSLTALPEEDIREVAINRLSRYQLVQQSVQHFWNRWSKEVLNLMQNRPKWWKMQPNLKEGALVMIKDDNLPPLKWKLGRVQEVHPDSQGTVRVATVKTTTGIIRRPIVKLCLLPYDEQPT